MSNARRGGPRSGSAPTPTSQDDGQGATEPLATTMPPGVARPDASSVSTAAPGAGGSDEATNAGPVSSVRAVWRGEQRFDTGRDGGPPARLDGSGETGQSPVDALLSALSTCSGADVVDILTKRRTPPDRVEMLVTARRRAAHPRRVLQFEIDYLIDGPGIDRLHTERAIALAIEKYCSVAATLNPDLVIETRVVLNGETGDWRRVAVPR